MQRNKIFALGLCVLGSIAAKAQVQDTIASSNQKLEEIVISGQYNPQAIDKAVHNVTVINRAKIENLGAITLADALNQVLNITIMPNTKTGKSGVKMFGLDAQYFTILIDNVPMISDEGFGNNTDLTQINLDDIAQIEIVEGAMGVDYGANAVSGIINIITKKNNMHDWNMNVFVQEESAGLEYDLKNKGKHIQGISLGHNINDNIYANVSYTHNDFKGWYNERKGFTYYGDEDLRGHEWMPKNQNNFKALLNFHKGSYRVYYKFEYFDERMKDYNHIFDMLEDPVFETVNPTAKDRIINTKRYVNVLNTSGNWRDWFRFDLSFSYQKQEREQESYRYRIKYDEKFDEENFKNESRDILYSRGTFSDFVKSDKVKFQLGYEITSNKGYSMMEEAFGEDPIKKTLSSYDFYASSEIAVFPKMMLRPGYRLMTSNIFSNQHAYSLTLKYVLPENIELRATYGTAPRLPNYDELYTYFVDVNHDLQGNPNLSPEKGNTIFVNLKKSYELNEDLELSHSLTGRYLNVQDKIDVIQLIDNGTKFRYENVDRYRNMGVTFLNQVSWKNLSAGIGFTFSGYAQQMFGAPTDTDKFLYTPEVNANVSYTVPNWNTIVSLFYKYNGEEYKYVVATDMFGEYYYKGKQDSYSWMDLTVRQPFLDKKLWATLGFRNLFDVKDIKSSINSGGAHSGASAVTELAYGRSVFLKLQYKLDF
ncbi:TonB-dependent receptor plug domain-containing protein [Myroides indicus]|uniref:Outer membrane receptor for ferrienterochelin and colicins n=1 Tax=Myroides indicus TaxID=1323422 RepID=A0A4R7EZA1_9FLAO|nr:TonB-dependent receptor [Myroides indicus]TDS60251.1 outer membrane receptor for ferrienterochelin and colicins [Myroides indicus]